MEAYAYVRVSLEEEEPENQRLAISRFAKEKGYEVVKWFEDVGISGAVPTWKRSSFRSLLDEVERDPRPVLVYELSRLGRSFYETLRAIQELESRGSPVIVVSPKESFLQTLDPQVRKLILAVLAWAAERERELLRQRTIEGMKRAKAQGKHVGRPPKHVDWRKVRELREKGVSWKDIARILDIGYTTLLRRAREVGLR